MGTETVNIQNFPGGKNMKRSLRAAVLLLCIGVSVFAQGGSSQLGGVVRDTTGALIPGVTVTATNTDTGVTNTLLTNESGAYNFASLQPGKAYKVSAALQGFQTKTFTNLELTVGANS